MMMADTMDALGLAGKYVVKVNNRKVLDGVLEAAGVADAGAKLTVMRAIDKLDKFGPEGVELLLGDGRKDESGDFTKGAGLNLTSSALFGHLLDLSISGQSATGRAHPWPCSEASTSRSHARCLRPPAMVRTGSRSTLGRPRPRILHRPRLRD